MIPNRLHHRALLLSLATLPVLAAMPGCSVGPDFKRPDAPVADKYNELPTTQPSNPEAQATKTAWWKSFNDPTLDRLIEKAYADNLSLRVAGLRVLEARAARGIAVGQFFPQVQSINGDFTHIGASRNTAVRNDPRFFDNTAVTFDAAWELDVWGKFRRGIESADAAVYSSVMNYDDALVTLVADVASEYINLRGLDERIRLAISNVDVQQKALDISNVRFRAGGTTELDVQQAKAQLTDTQSLIPPLQQARRQSENRLCTLLGIPPSNLAELLGPPPANPGYSPVVAATIAPPMQPASTTTQPSAYVTAATANLAIPTPPDNIAVGIPADLLRRRPDVRRAEADAAAQSALIGFAKADLYPHFRLFGSIGYQAEDPSDLFNSSSLIYQLGPAFRWDILNYGQITNNVRIQDARFEQTLTRYQDTVLNAQRDVSDAITAFIHSKEQAQFLADSVTAAVRAVELATTQYRSGGADFIRVLNATAVLVQEQDRLVIARTNIATSAVSLNRALGGGWELRQNAEFVSPEVLERMHKRTDWGNITSPDYAQKKDIGLAPRHSTTRLSSDPK